MPPRRRWLLQSAQSIDPISWFTRTNVPLACAALVVVYGFALIAAQWGASRAPVGQLASVALAAGACVLVHVITRPMRPPIGWVLASLVFSIVVAAVAVSALDYSGAPFAIEFWWAPSAITLATASLAPYLTAPKLLVLGGSATGATVVIGMSLLEPFQNSWGALGFAVLIGYSPILGVLATATFSYSIVSTMSRMLDGPSRNEVDGRVALDEAANVVERVTLAQLSARAAPFLERIADAGVVSPEERVFAGQLARRIRDDLVTQSNLTWLDSIAQRQRLVVVDPMQRARAMDDAQRTALRALLQAILDTPGGDSGSLLVELREAPDGATAVVVSLDIAPRQGLRIMHLAPYLLALGTAVEDLTVDRHALEVTFRVTPGGERP